MRNGQMLLGAAFQGEPDGGGESNPSGDGTPQADQLALSGEQAADTTKSVGDGFGEFLTNVWKGDFSADTWIAFWQSVGQPVLLALVLIIAVFLLAGWVRRLVEKACDRAETEETLARFLARTARYAVLVAGGIAILGTLGVDTASLAALVAGAGFAIGMALSGTLGNVAAGVLLLFLRPFKVGDVVAASGITGKVYEIGLFNTIFDTFDNKRIFVPNKKLFDDNVENVTFHETRRVDVPVGTGYDDDIDAVRRALEGVVERVEGRIAEPESQVFLESFGDSSINWKVRVWATREEMWDVHQRIIRDVKVAFDEAGIGIPFPQRDVHVPGQLTVHVAKQDG